MQLEPDATSRWGCGAGPFNDPNSNTFKPNTLNHISTRPNTSTSFNMLAENIDFSIYGYRSTTSGNYDANLFSLDSSGNNKGLIPAFLIDSNIDNAVSGSMSSGVFLTGYLDRAKLLPTGYYIDESPKVCINTRTPYVIASISNKTAGNLLSSYSSLTVNGSTYTDSLITKELYVTPKPGIAVSSEYVVNALLTINAAGKIISRKPTINPTAPPSPTNVSLLVSGHKEFSISWTQSSDGGKKIINYIIESSMNGGGTWTTVSTDKILRGMSSQTSCTIIGQEPSINYSFRVSAQNAIGISNPSEASVSMTSNGNVPQCPKNMVQTRTFGESTSDIALSWTAPAEYGSTAVSGYVIQESENDGISWVNYNNTSDTLITDREYETIYGLSNNIDYLYRVYAINDSGQSTYAFVRSSGNSLLEEEVDEAIKDVLSNWDFGSILFTGVCTV